MAQPAGAPISRSTRQRTAIISALDEARSFLTAQQLHQRLAGNGERVGLATVYRSLQALTAAGKVDVLRTAEGEAIYRRCSQGHHHHLVCRTCGRTVEVEGPAVERWTAQVASEHGYVDVSHTLEIFGTCASCVR